MTKRGLSFPLRRGQESIDARRIVIWRMLGLCLLSLGLSGLSLLLPASARAAVNLKTAAWATRGDYIEIVLGFDAKSPAYSESFRYDPDRYVLSLTGCQHALPKEASDKLAAIAHPLLSKISVRNGGENCELGFYLSLAVHPFIRTEDKNLILRFYTATRMERNTTLAPGVSLTEKGITRGGENLAAYIVRIDRSALSGEGAAQLYSVSGDRYDRKTRLRAPSSYARKERAEVVINGGFFGKQGQHLSTLVEKGLMRATGVYPTRPMLVVSDSGEVLIGRYNVVTALVYTDPKGEEKRLTVNAKNYPFQQSKVMVYDQDYPIETLPQEAMFYYLLRNHKIEYHGSNTKGLTLGEGVLLLATDIIPEANPLQDVPDGSSVALETKLTDETGRKLRAESAIGGAPMLVENGQVEISVAEDKVQADIAKSERSRTAVGLTKGGTLLLVVVKETEGQNYGGLTLKALAELLISEGTVTAMNLDGGGSSAMVVAGHVLNCEEAEQRPVSNALVLKLAGPQGGS
ncbi:phosphodiester glycosidase family protein [bacterium]|nr:phosphodiester glycosidase family protein [bacterium]